MWTAPSLLITKLSSVPWAFIERFFTIIRSVLFIETSKEWFDLLKECVLNLLKAIYIFKTKWPFIIICLNLNGRPLCRSMKRMIKDYQIECFLNLLNATFKLYWSKYLDTNYQIEGKLERKTALEGNSTDFSLSKRNVWNLKM